MKEAYILLLLIFISSSGIVLSSSQILKENVRHFNGYKVLRVDITTQKQLDIILDIQTKDSTLDFWSGPAFPGGADIMVSPKQYSSIVQHFTTHGITYKTLIEDIENIIEQQKQAQASEVQPRFWTSYQRMDAIYKWMDALEIVFPNLVSIQTIGNSTLGNPLRLLKLSTGGTTRKPTIFIDATFHAREFISTATVTWMLNDLLTNSAKYQDILNGVDMYILPISNPDGYEYAHTINRLWRKTRSINANSSCIGTDLNRNFNHQWGGIGTSSDPCSDIYHGSSPCSEPECQAISHFIINTKANWWAYISFHSASQMWLTPWGFTDESVYDNSDMLAMGNRAVEALTKVHGTKYKVGPSSTTIYYTSGTSADWARGIAGIKYSLTVELRDTGEYGHLLPPEQIIPSGEETVEALKAVAREVMRQHKCSNLSPVSLQSVYTPQGDVTIVNGMETYETRDKSSKTMLIAVHDILGFNPSTNIWQICDKMAESGVRVVLPDFFRGEWWEPPSSQSNKHYMYPTDPQFVDQPTWESTTRADLIEIVKHYKKEGIEKCGIFGFCFGGQVSARATGEFSDDFKVAAHFHPSLVNISDAVLIKRPTLLLPGANDPDMTEYCKVINDNNGEGTCKYIHFRDVNHGWAGGRSDWNNATIVGRANEAVTLSRDFICENLKFD